MQIDDNLEVSGTGDVTCRHCGAALGNASDNPLANALRREQPSTEASPGVHVAPAAFTDRTVVLRQAFCPSCLALLSTEIVPADEPEYRSWSVSA